jgi:hypothetical protein
MGFNSSGSGKIGQFVSHVVPGILRPLRILWNEIIGFVFIVLAIVAAPSAVRAFRDFDRGEGTLTRFILPLVWALVMAYFGITSFLRARKIGRS